MHYNFNEYGLETLYLLIESCVEHVIKTPNLTDLWLVCLMASPYVHVCRSLYFSISLFYILIWVKLIFQWTTNKHIFFPAQSPLIQK